MVARVVAAALCACLAIHAWGPADLLAVPERPFAYGNGDVRIEAAAFPRHATGADDVRVRIAHAPRRIVKPMLHGPPESQQHSASAIPLAPVAVPAIGD